MSASRMQSGAALTFSRPVTPGTATQRSHNGSDTNTSQHAAPPQNRRQTAHPAVQGLSAVYGGHPNDGVLARAQSVQGQPRPLTPHSEAPAHLRAAAVAPAHNAGSSSQPQRTSADGASRSQRSGTSLASSSTAVYSTRKVKVVEYLRRRLLPLHKGGRMSREDMIIVCSTVCREFMDERRFSEADMASTSNRPLPTDDEALLSTLLLATLRDLDTLAKKEREPSQPSPAVVEEPPIASAMVPYDEAPSPAAPLPMALVSSQAGASLFESVSYTISGAYPRHMVAFNPRIGDQHLRVALSSPSVQDADADIVVASFVSTRVPVALTWWLAYGPQRIVLNLDQMYVDGLATTYQISDTSFILTFRPGTLVAGWDYAVCLGASTASGTSVSAETMFCIPGVAGTHRLLEEERRLQAMHGSPQTRGPNPYGSRTQGGYYGDTDLHEDEVRQQRRLEDGPRQAEGHWDGLPSTYDLYVGTSTMREGYQDVIHGRPRDAMGGTALYSDQRDVGQPHEPPREAAADDAELRANIHHHQSAYGVRGAIHPDYVPPVPPQAATYQEQLRHFFVEQVEPLYYLSPNPAMPEDAFRALVKDVARRFWFAYPKQQPLTDEIRREIIHHIKEGISATALTTRPAPHPHNRGEEDWQQQQHQQQQLQWSSQPQQQAPSSPYAGISGGYQ